MVVYIGVAADCTYAALNSSTGGTRSQILQDMNSVSNLYRSTFNVSIGVVDMEVRDANCPSTASADAAWNVGCDGSNAPSLDQRLSLFSQWRGDRDANGTGLWHLLTTCQSGSEVGVAWLGESRSAMVAGFVCCRWSRRSRLTKRRLFHPLLGTLCQTTANGQGNNVVSGAGVTSATLREYQIISHEIGRECG